MGQEVMAAVMVVVVKVSVKVVLNLVVAAASWSCCVQRFAGWWRRRDRKRRHCACARGRWVREGWGRACCSHLSRQLWVVVKGRVAVGGWGGVGGR